MVVEMKPAERESIDELENWVNRFYWDELNRDGHISPPDATMMSRSVATAIVLYRQWRKKEKP
jgi:hypothetical protein